MDEEQKVYLLGKGSRGQDEDTILSTPRKFRTIHNRAIVALTIALVISIACNAVFIVNGEYQQVSTTVRKSKFAGLPEDVEVEFTGPTDFSSDNETLADSLWNSLDTAGGAVALSDEYVEANGLHPAERFWWDDGKGIYYVQGFHLLHCVKELRRSYFEFVRGLPQTDDEDHIKHCLDALRLGVMCYASDNLLPLQHAPLAIGEGQVQQCRSWKKLEQWALAPERNACYRGGEDEPASRGIKRFLKCPENSPYKARVAAYLAEKASKGTQDEESHEDS